MAAAVTAAISTASTSNTTSYASGSFTPAAGDLLVAFVVATATVDPGSMTDSQSIGFNLITSAVKNSSGDTLYAFVSDGFAANSSMTVTFNCPGDAATGAVIQVFRISGMTYWGINAIVQSAIQSNQASSGTPAPAFTNNANTNNITLGFVGNATNPATLTQPTGWTEGFDDGYASPTTGAECVYRNSGFSGKTITWGSTSASAFGAITLEINTAALPTISLNTADASTFTTLTPTLNFTGTEANSTDLSYEIEISDTNFSSFSTPTYSQGASAGASSSVATLGATFGSNTTTGNAVVALVVQQNGLIPTGVTDSQSNTYRRAIINTDGGNFTDVWYATNITGGTTPTVTATFGTTSPGAIIIFELTNIDKSHFPVDQYNFAVGTSNAPNSGNITTTIAKQVLVGLAHAQIDSSHTLGVGTGYSNFTAANYSLGSVNRAGGETQIVSSTSTYSAGFTLGSSLTWSAVIASFIADTTHSFLTAAYSPTDSGFADITNPGDTDPFASGDQIGYTSSALTNGSTYYWRARAVARTGNYPLWGAWSSVRSFTIQTKTGGGMLPLMGIG